MKFNIYLILQFGGTDDNIVVEVCYWRGFLMLSDLAVDHREKAYALLKADADKILKLIKVQMDNLTMPQCPLYEEVLDTQMFGLSREIDFAVRLDLITEGEGKALLDNLEQQLNVLHEAAQKS
ncbi:uncharacterized protein YlaN (UPF0358 family) [Thalassobacillus devorans]|nr:uncharacterized protein YlaN (UPF0358 family) [Thalassobacillus devorans]